MTVSGSMPITNNDNYIDARDIDIRIDYLAYLDDIEELTTEELDDAADEIEELRQLRELFATLSDDLNAGTLIGESAFEDYARDFAQDLYELDGTGASAYFDYDSFADDYQSDHTSVEFDGVTYYYQG